MKKAVIFSPVLSIKLKIKPHISTSFTLHHCYFHSNPRRNNTGKERDSETGLYYYGARYLDPKASRWLSGDPVVGEYVPSAPVSDEARKRNGNLPGMGGVFNYVNLHVYHYAGNNPVKYIDPDGEIIRIEANRFSTIDTAGMIVFTNTSIGNQMLSKYSDPKSPSFHILLSIYNYQLSGKLGSTLIFYNDITHEIISINIRIKTGLNIQESALVIAQTLPTELREAFNAFDITKSYENQSREFYDALRTGTQAYRNNME